MMDISHLHGIRHDKSFTDDSFKEKEIEKYETNYPGLKIIKNNYKSDNALESDWLAFLSLPQYLRAIADEKALFLFGKKNEEMYKIVKSKFLKNDVASPNLFNYYSPSGLRENEGYLDPINNVYIIKDDIIDLDTLNGAWEAYLSQSDDQREISDSISLVNFGKTVPEMYNDILKKINANNINNSDYDFFITYSPPTNMVEAFFTELDYIVDESNDLIEKMIFLKQMKNRANTIVLETLVKELEDNINKKIINENLLDIVGANFFLPQEIMQIYENTDELKNNKMFLNYAGRFYGIKPRKGFTNESRTLLSKNDLSDNDKIKLGWNPIMEYSEENIHNAHKRSMTILNDNVNCNFIPLYNTPGDRYYDQLPKGLSIITIYECNRNHNVPDGISRALVSFDCLNENWYQYAYSKLMTQLNVDKVLSEYKEPLVDCFFLEMNKPLHDNYLSLVSKFNLNSNYLTEFTELLKESTPNINNPKAFVYSFIKGLFESNRIYPHNYSIYHILSEFSPTYKDILNSHSKILSISKFNEFDHSNYLSEFLHISPLEEASNLPVEFDEDGNMFIKKKENIDFAAEYSNCHKLLKQYEKIENYEAIKYYVAKLWYMNILIEKKLYQKNKDEKLQSQLPEYYKTRAHILNDFNIYMSKILKREPDFDFQKYYENTPFDQSMVKVSKNLLAQVWALFKTLIFG